MGIFDKLLKPKKINNKQDMESQPISKNTPTIASLSKTSDKYWKFSQSKPGLSQENGVYASYEKGTYTTAMNPKKLLSFVSSENIGTCVGYGDQLTELCFDLSNPEVAVIKDNEVHFFGGGLGEYETKQLFVSNNYSLKDPKTICMIVDMSSTKATMHFLMRATSYLKQYDFTESIDFIDFLSKKYDFMSIYDLKVLKQNVYRERDHFLSENDKIDDKITSLDKEITLFKDNQNQNISQTEKSDIETER